MASSDNAINEVNTRYCENPIGLEDGEYDPDLEARLYAEIYYSNETYIPDSESPIDKATLNISQDAATAKPSTVSLVTNGIVADVNSALPSTEIQLPIDNFVDNFLPPNNIDDQNFYIGQTYYPNRNQLLEKPIESSRVTVEPQAVGTGSARKRQRQLAQTDLWLTLENNGVDRVTTICEDNLTPGGSANVGNVVVTPVTNPENDVTCGNSRTRAKKNFRNRKRRNLRKNVSKQACGKATSSQHDYPDHIGETGTSDKYKVLSKKRKMKDKKKNVVSLEISSDSDDSILEVPVPPKPAPPIIQLADSDDECGRSADDRLETTETLDVREHNDIVTLGDIEEGSLTNDAFSKSLATESAPTQTHESLKETRNNVTNVAETSGALGHSEDDALILNCTGIQQGASSLDEIRRMPDTGPSTNGQSDDSMTESEANNWGRIAAGQSNAQRDDDIRSMDLSNDTINNELWKQLGHENTTSASIPTEIPISSCDGSAADQMVVDKDKISNVSMTNKEAAGPRKRQKESASKPFTDFDVPAIPRKRSKQVKDKTMSEYFFKPMSKELQAYYNNPWGGENLNVYEIQSRMPQNPSFWGILDADLRGPNCKKRKTCGRCNSDSHFGKRCLQKAKAPCCYMCGVMGHTESRCPHTMCLTCGRKYATYRPTCDYCCKLYCNMCNVSGHSNENCPDLWRRYHNTTTEMIPLIPGDVSNIMKSPQQLSCCNCGRRGHDATTCRQLRWSQHFPTPTFVSSYTEGPFYESSNREQTRDTLPNVDSIHDLPHEERVSRQNFTADRDNAPPHQERMPDTTPSNDIEVIEICDEHGASLTEPTSSIPSRNVIFQIGEVDLPEAMRLHRVVRLLDQVENVHLDGLLNGRRKPTFLIKLVKLFRFRVRITLESEKKSRMIIESLSPVLLKGLEKLMIQWLTRTDDEKPYLEYSILPYEDRTRMYKSVKKKLTLLENVLDPDVLWKKIVACEDALRRIRAKKRSAPNNAKFQNKMIRNEMRENSVLMKRRNELVTSLYSLSWVDGGDAVVRSFQEVARRLGLTKKFQVRQYLELIYLNNELFTVHTSEALSRALDKALMASQLLEPINATVAKQPLVQTPDAKVPETVARPIDNVEVSEEKNCTTHVPNQPMIVDDSFSVQSSPITPNDERQITASDERQLVPKIFGAPYAVNEIASNNNNDGPGVGGALNSPFRLLSVNGTDSQSVAQRPTSLQRKNPDPFFGAKKIRTAHGLLTNLPKRKRYTYRRAAKKAIKVALMTHEPHLREMAKALKLKSKTDTITTDDVDRLRSAIGPDLARILTSRLAPKNGQSETEADSRYQSFLKSL